MDTNRPHPTHWARHARHVRATTRLLATATGRPRRVVVTGPSMLPGLADGDRLVVVPTRRLRPGDVVAVADPRRSDRLLVKRIYRLDGDRVELRGDNESASTDSRAFGPVPRSSIVGRAVYRYQPADRAGWLPGREG